ncbi:hypothetical protein ACIBFB_09260 [Nocardiopsis sp. NPDC050513]|uniref:hypothetical protein n=1 Tax=Nocardiopsis sp. NPDC050513 TaxID=3364338 RepID=UPI0037A7150F
MRPELRMLIGVARSGTTAFLHLMSQSPHVRTATWSMKSTLRDGHVDYGVYDRLCDRPVLFYKASFGRRSPAECRYDPFRSVEDVVTVRLLFLFRDPVQCLNSWRRMGWGRDVELFSVAYRHALDLCRTARGSSDSAVCVSYEHLAAHADSIFPQIFSHWGIPYEGMTVAWAVPVGGPSISVDWLSERRLKMMRHLGSGLHASLVRGPQRYRYVSNEVVLSRSEVNEVERLFRREYEEVDDAGRCRFPASSGLLRESWEGPGGS